MEGLAHGHFGPPLVFVKGFRQVRQVRQIMSLCFAVPFQEPDLFPGHQ